MRHHGWQAYRLTGRSGAEQGRTSLGSWREGSRWSGWRLYRSGQCIRPAGDGPGLRCHRGRWERRLYRLGLGRYGNGGWRRHGQRLRFWGGLRWRPDGGRRFLKHHFSYDLPGRQRGLRAFYHAHFIHVWRNLLVPTLWLLLRWLSSFLAHNGLVMYFSDHLTHGFDGFMPWRLADDFPHDLACFRVGCGGRRSLWRYALRRSWLGAGRRRGRGLDRW